MFRCHGDARWWLYKVLPHLPLVGHTLRKWKRMSAICERYQEETQPPSLHKTSLVIVKYRKSTRYGRGNPKLVVNTSILARTPGPGSRLRHRICFPSKQAAQRCFEAPRAKALHHNKRTAQVRPSNRRTESCFGRETGSPDIPGLCDFDPLEIREVSPGTLPAVELRDVDLICQVRYV